MRVGGEMENEIVLFESEDDPVKLNVEFDGETAVGARYLDLLG